MTPALPRFAVAGFPNKGDAEKSAIKLRSGANPAREISYLGLRSALSGLPSETLTYLPFSDLSEAVASSAGHVAEQLAMRATKGAPTLQAALCTWLIPRHADLIQSAVVEGNVVLWVRLDDANDERWACRTLLSTGCNWVGVHDLL